jgi:hypothetical protein
MDNGYACSGIHDGAAQLPSGHQRHRPDLAGRRLCSDYADELDGDLWRLRDTNAHADSHGDRYSYSYGNGYGNRYSYRYAHTYGHVRRYNNNKTTRLGALLVSA